MKSAIRYCLGFALAGVLLMGVSAYAGMGGTGVTRSLSSVQSPTIVTPTVSGDLAIDGNGNILFDTSGTISIKQDDATSALDITTASGGSFGIATDQWNHTVTASTEKTYNVMQLTQDSGSVMEGTHLHLTYLNMFTKSSGTNTALKLDFTDVGNSTGSTVRAIHVTAPIATLEATNAALQVETGWTHGVKNLSPSLFGANGNEFTTLTTGTCSVDPASIGAATVGTGSCTAAGVTATAQCHASAPGALSTSDSLIAVAANDPGSGTITVYIYNATGGAIDGAARTWAYTCHD